MSNQQPDEVLVEKVKDTRVDEEIYRVVHHLYLTAWADGKYEDSQQMVRKVDDAYLTLSNLMEGSNE